MPQKDDFYCTDLAWKYGVSLIGTATRGDTWFLIEYPGRWEAKAFERSSIPSEVKARIAAIAPPGRTLRTLLIRQPGSHQPGFRFFVGQIDPLAPRLYEYHLLQYEDLLSLDLASLAAGEAGDQAHLRVAPLCLVCTNGRRDRCCALYGPEVYQALAAVDGEAVWQSSHIGGHNQAPISLFLPHGVNYGHTTPTEASRLLRAYKEKQLVLHHYRGRVCYPSHVQAAAHFWRAQTGVLDLPGLQVEAVEETGTDRWMVTIQAVVGGQRKQIHLESRESDLVIPVSCSGSKEIRVRSYHRVG
jgi:hypothetical protein